MKLKTTQLLDFDNLELKEATFQKASFPNHFHDTYSVGIIKEGVEKVKVNNQNLIAPANTVVILNPFEVHSNLFYDTEKWTYCSLYLNEDILKFCALKNNLRFKPGIEFQNLITDTKLFGKLSDFHKNPTQNTQKQLTNISSNLILNHQRELPGQPKYYEEKKTLIDEVTIYFEHNFFKKININAISRKYKLKSSQFIRAFKANKGLTPIAYITLLRLNHSKKLILQNQSIVQVALECGFYDQSHFTHYFLKFFGVSPLTFKKNALNI